MLTDVVASAGFWDSPVHLLISPAAFLLVLAHWGVNGRFGQAVSSFPIHLHHLVCLQSDRNDKGELWSSPCPFGLVIPAASVSGGGAACPTASLSGGEAEFGALPSYVPAPLVRVAQDELPQDLLRFVLVQVNDVHPVPNH